MRFRATRRLVRSSVLAGVLLFGAVALGRLELAVVAIPFLLLLAFGSTGDRDASIEAEVRVPDTRLLEGDSLRLEICLASERGADEVEYALEVPAGFETAAGDPRAVVPLAPGVERCEEVVLQAVRWGAYDVGRLALWVHGPGGLTRARSSVGGTERVRVYPQAEAVRTRPVPPDTQVLAGNYVARSQGEGIEFAAVREFSPGDSVRRVNWRVTSRRGELFVNQHHPERNADVVFFIDSFTEVGPSGRSSLDLSVRGTAALARHYLGFKDRVGLVTFGGIVGWLNASMGEAHVHRVVDYLLDVGVHPSYAWKEIAYLPPRLLPPMSLVLLFSPLVDERAVAAIHDLHRRGHHLIVIDVLDETAVHPDRSEEGRVAYRAWKLSREALRFDLVSAGVPVVSWDGRGSLEEALARVPRRRPRRRA